MKRAHPSKLSFTSLHRRSLLVLLAVAAMGITTARADSPTDTFASGTSLLKASGWSTSAVPTANVTGIITITSSGNPLGWNYNTNPGSSTIGDLDFTSGTTKNVVVGDYTTAATSGNVNITLAGSTLNSQANTIIANSSGKTIVFENDVDPASGDLATESGTTTLTLGNTTNVIQANSSSTIIIDNVIAGSGDSITFLGGGSSGTTGGTLELGAGSSNDVVGGYGANVPSSALGTAFTGSAVTQTGDTNSFTGGLTIGDVGGTANVGVVQIDSANALPTIGTVTVNANSELLLDVSATYGVSGQNLVLNGSGSHSTPGALTSNSGTNSTWAGTVNLASTSFIDTQGSTGGLTLGGIVSGTGSAGLTKQGAGSLSLPGLNTYTGPTVINNGTIIANTLAASGSSSSSSIGAAANTASNLVLNTGTLQYTGGTTSTDHNFDFGNASTASGGGIDNEGTGPLTFSGSMTSLNTAASTQTLTLTANTASGSNVFSGTISDGNTGGGALTGLTKAGLGTWSLSNAANTYTGPTTVSGGTLDLTASGAAGGTTAVNLTAGTLIADTGTTNAINSTATVSMTAGATLTVNGATQTIGALTLLGTGASHINFGSGTSTLTLGASVNGSGWAAGSTLDIDNWVQNTTEIVLSTATSGSIGTGGGAGYTSAELADVTWTGGADNGITGAEIVFTSGHYELQPDAVPEPTTVFAGVCLLVLLGWRNRRQIIEASRRVLVS